jgi:hypothetical protein
MVHTWRESRHRTEKKRKELTRSDSTLQRKGYEEPRRRRIRTRRMKSGGVHGTMRRALSEQRTSGSNRPNESIDLERSGKSAPPDVG